MGGINVLLLGKSIDETLMNLTLRHHEDVEKEVMHRIMRQGERGRIIPRSI
jgi:hypothetical protein